MPAATFSGYSYTFYVSDGVASTYPINFEYLDPNHVKVYVDGDLQESGFDYQITNGSVVFSPVPVSGLDVQVLRETPLEYDQRAVDFRAFGSITEDEMDVNQKQIWYLIQEASERDDAGTINPNASYLSWDSIRSVWDGRRNGAAQRISDVADPADDDDAANKAYVDSIAEFGAVGVPQTWVFTTSPATNNYTLTNGANLNQNYLIVALQGVLQTPGVDFTVTPGTTSSVLTFPVAPPTGQHLSIQNFGRSRLLPTLILGDNAVATNNIQNGAVTSDKIGSSAVTETKLASAAVTSDKIGSSAVTETKIAGASIPLTKLKTTGFTSAFGGSYDHYLKVDRVSGNLIVEEASVLDLSDWLSEIGDVRLSALAVPNQNVSMGGYALTNLASPTGGVGVGSPGTQAATKQYVLDQVASANANNIELLDDINRPGGVSTIDLVSPGTLPAWFTNSDYLYYTFAIHRWRVNGNPSPNVIQWQAYEGGAWVEKGKFNGLIAYDNVLNTFEVVVTNPRNTSSRASVKASGGTNQVTGQPALAPLAGLRLVQEGNGVVLAEAVRILVYGHRGLV